MSVGIILLMSAAISNRVPGRAADHAVPQTNQIGDPIGSPIWLQRADIAPERKRLLLERAGGKRPA